MPSGKVLLKVKYRVMTHLQQIIQSQTVEVSYILYGYYIHIPMKCIQFGIHWIYIIILQICQCSQVLESLYNQHIQSAFLAACPKTLMRSMKIRSLYCMVYIYVALSHLL